MDPSILKTTSESEEDQTIDRKVLAPLDPSTLHEGVNGVNRLATKGEKYY